MAAIGTERLEKKLRPKCGRVVFQGTRVSVRESMRSDSYKLSNTAMSLS